MLTGILRSVSRRRELAVGVAQISRTSWTQSGHGERARHSLDVAHSVSDVAHSAAVLRELAEGLHGNEAETARVAKRLRRRTRSELESLMQEPHFIEARVTANGHADYDPPPERKALLRLATARAIPFIGFGFFDNALMILAGDRIDSSVGANKQTPLFSLHPTSSTTQPHPSLTQTHPLPRIRHGVSHLDDGGRGPGQRFLRRRRDRRWERRGAVGGAAGTTRPRPLARPAPLPSGNRFVAWPLHNIAITNIVWCMAYNRGVGGEAYIEQWSCNGIAIG